MTTSTPLVPHAGGLLRERAILGLAFVAIAAAMAGGTIAPGIDRFVLLAISGICLAAFGLGRAYGFAVAAGITGGLGVMVLVNADAALDPMTGGAVFFASLAAGFASIWLLGLGAVPRERSPWPLAPAAILGLLGLALTAGQPVAFDWLQVGLAAILAVAGAGLIVRRAASRA